MNQANIKKRALIGGIALVCVISFAYWIHGLFFESTDDAYVNANVVHIAPRVTGLVKKLSIINNQYVKQGQPLFDLDTATFDASVEQSRAQLAVNQSNLKLAEATAERTNALLKRNVASAQENDNNQASLHAALANVALAQANLSQAELNLSYTSVVAPTSGWVNNVSLREGDVVSANSPLFVLVSDKEFWVDANFKETELEKLHAGQEADVTVDMYPGHIFKGIVESISSSTGAAFSLLPPENATGNWVKVTQRIPVRIRITDPSPDFPLRIGGTATVTVRMSPWSSGK